jgi:hypothetical protein
MYTQGHETFCLVAMLGSNRLRFKYFFNSFALAKKAIISFTHKMLSDDFKNTALDIKW